MAWRVGVGLARAGGRFLWGLRIERHHGFPRPPFVIASNHHSFLDPPLVATAWGRPVRFLALVDLYGNYRWLDAVLDFFEVIPIRRGTVPLGAIRRALEHLDRGGVVGLFPEGTRYWSFDRAHARPGAAWLAIRAGVPLVPVAVIGSEQVLGVDNRLNRGRIRVVVGPALQGRGGDRADVDDLIARWGEWIESCLR